MVTRLNGGSNKGDVLTMSAFVLNAANRVKRIDLLSRPYYINVDMSKYIALIIDNLNHDASLSELLNPTSRINRLLDRYRAGDR